MDSHDVGRDRGPLAEVLRRVRPPVLVVSIDSDVLYPAEEQLELAQLLRRGELAMLRSDHGHDGFLVDDRGLDRIVEAWRRRIEGRDVAATGAVEAVTNLRTFERGAA